MFRIKVPATSANLGCGFDVLGLALAVYNEYTFEQSDKFVLEGFASKYLDANNNLVVSSYKKAFEKAGEKIIPAKIVEVERNIPRSGGLGSSAGCAVAGILGANKMMNGKLSMKQMIELATEIDGHPDNVSATLLGGFTACMKTENGLHCEKYSVSDKLKFMICYPDFYVSTQMAREVLPKTVELKNAVSNLSRIVNMPRAFETGNLSLIKECVKDKLHEPFRIKLIDEGDVIKKTAEDNNAVAIISGSGSAMLIISDSENVFEKFQNLQTKHKWTLLPCQVCRKV